MNVEELTDLVFAVARGPRGKELAELLLARAREYDPPVIAAVVEAVAEELDLEAEQVVGKSQLPKIVEARHLAMYLASLLTRETYTEIGRCIGRRSHSTVIHAVKKFEALLASDCGEPLRAVERRVLARLGNDRRRREVGSACTLPET